jgi:hypothetical protein
MASDVATRRTKTRMNEIIAEVNCEINEAYFRAIRRNDPAPKNKIYFLFLNTIIFTLLRIL